VVSCLFIWQWVISSGGLRWPIMRIVRQPRRTVSTFPQPPQFLGGNPSWLVGSRIVLSWAMFSLSGRIVVLYFSDKFAKKCFPTGGSYRIQPNTTVVSDNSFLAWCRVLFPCRSNSTSGLQLAPL
jgi:hypothetical protein